MSRIFDALQRSEFDGRGFQMPEPESLPADLLPGELVPLPSRNLAGSGSNGLDQFKSVATSVSPESRLVCLTAQESLAAEKFRFLGVRLRQLQQDRQLKSLLITSSMPDEGKSTVSANLAIALGRRKQKVLLLEGDLRRPGLAGRFGLTRLRGLSQWLRKDEGAGGDICRLEEAGIWFLPAGTSPENAVELMQSGRLAGIIEQLRSWFDWVVIDSPPVLPLGDTSIWARLSDGILLVAREGTTEKRPLQRTVRVLEQSKLLGVVLNNSTNADHGAYYQRYDPSLGEQAKVKSE